MANEADAISVWLSQVKRGDRQRLPELFEHYFRRLVGLAATRLRGDRRWDGYEEDVALSAFKSLCLGAERGRYPDLSDRDALWRLLAVITVRKAIDLQRKRRHEEAWEDSQIEHVLQQDPSPSDVAEMSEQVAHLLDRLGDEELRRIALWKVEGCSNQEIAEQLQCVERTVERKLHRIRLIWQEDLPA